MVPAATLQFSISDAPVAPGGVPRLGRHSPDGAGDDAGASSAEAGFDAILLAMIGIGPGQAPTADPARGPESVDIVAPPSSADAITEGSESGRLRLHLKASTAVGGDASARTLQAFRNAAAEGAAPAGGSVMVRRSGSAASTGVFADVDAAATAAIEAPLPTSVDASSAVASGDSRVRMTPEGPGAPMRAEDPKFDASLESDATSTGTAIVPESARGEVSLSRPNVSVIHSARGSDAAREIDPRLSAVHPYAHAAGHTNAAADHLPEAGQGVEIPELTPGAVVAENSHGRRPTFTTEASGEKQPTAQWWGGSASDSLPQVSVAQTSAATQRAKPTAARLAPPDSASLGTATAAATPAIQNHEQSHVEDATDVVALEAEDGAVASEQADLGTRVITAEGDRVARVRADTSVTPAASNIATGMSAEHEAVVLGTSEAGAATSEAAVTVVENGAQQRQPTVPGAAMPLPEPGTASSSATATTDPAGPGSIPRQMSDAIVAWRSVALEQGTARFAAWLSPPELGQVWVELTRSPRGIAARISAADEGVQSILESHAPALRQSLSESGITLSDLDVSGGAGRQSQQDSMDERHLLIAFEEPATPSGPHPATSGTHRGAVNIRA